MGDEFIPIEQAAQQSGLHINTLKRLLREGVIEGYKAIYQRKRRWMVSVVSLRQYTDPVYGFLLDLPGPKLFLRRIDEEDEEED
jgi:DNA-binding Lrp family transcriptional regulator